MPSGMPQSFRKYPLLRQFSVNHSSFTCIPQGDTSASRGWGECGGIYIMDLRGGGGQGRRAVHAGGNAGAC